MKAACTHQLEHECAGAHVFLETSTCNGFSQEVAITIFSCSISPNLRVAIQPMFKLYRMRVLPCNYLILAILLFFLNPEILKWGPTARFRATL